jgi:hypothetical protein
MSSFSFDEDMTEVDTFPAVFERPADALQRMEDMQMAEAADHNSSGDSNNNNSNHDEESC